jgi:hypothetical protein
MSKFIYLQTFTDHGCSWTNEASQKQMFMRKENIDCIKPYVYENMGNKFHNCSFLHTPTGQTLHCEIDSEELIYLLDKED